MMNPTHKFQRSSECLTICGSRFEKERAKKFKRCKPKIHASGAQTPIPGTHPWLMLTDPIPGSPGPRPNDPNHLRITLREDIAISEDIFENSYDIYPAKIPEGEEDQSNTYPRNLERSDGRAQDNASLLWYYASDPRKTFRKSKLNLSCEEHPFMKWNRSALETTIISGACKCLMHC